MENRWIRAVVTAFLAMVVLAACGDDDGGGGDAASFCADAKGFDERFQNLEGEGDVPDASQMGELVDALKSVDPPSEIEDDWNKLTEGLEEFAQILEDVDPEDPTSFLNLDPEDLEKLESFGAEFEEAGTNVETFLQEECGIDTDE